MYNHISVLQEHRILPKLIQFLKLVIVYEAVNVNRNQGNSATTFTPLRESGYGLQLFFYAVNISQGTGKLWAEQTGTVPGLFPVRSEERSIKSWQTTFGAFN